MKKTLKVILVLALTSLAIGFTSCSKKDQQVVRISHIDGYSFPHNTGIEQGIFQKNLKAAGYDNVKIELVNFKKGAEAVEAAQAGQIDLITCGDQMVTTAILANGLPYKLISANYVNKDWAYVASAKSGIKTPADIKGKKLGALLGHNQYLSTLAFIEANGYSIDKDIDFYNLSLADQVTAFQTGEIDWALFYAANLNAVLERNPDAVILGYNGDYKSNVSIIAVNNDFGSKNHNLVVALLKGIQEATLYSIAHPDQAVKDAVKNADADEATVKTFFDTCTFVIPFDNEILDSVQKTLHYSYLGGLIPEDSSVNDVIDFTYLKEAGLYK